MNDSSKPSPLRDYLDSLPIEERKDFAKRCGTTLAYLRKALSIGQQLGVKLVVNAERESGGRVRAESLRPDVDWAYLKTRKPKEKSR